MAAVTLLAALPAAAQISPGELSRPHADLEGSAGCPRCHEPGQGITAARCLACHGALAARMAEKRGLHAGAEYVRCQTCHVEHQGRDVDLVWWGEAGRSAFDHSGVGYRLEGRHATLHCEQCHTAALVRDPAALRAGGADPARSFLGLGTGCTDCHADVHRGQLGGQCHTCHAQDAWRPAPGFDHDRARYRLDGRHAGLTCERCHAEVGDVRGTFRRYRPVAFAACTDCHRDPHAGRLGAGCADCHSTDGWTRVTRGAFDHDRTAYPLRGRHGRVACERCHTAGRTGRLAHARCADCHADAHRGELATRADGGRCEACHTVDAPFAPARFGVEEHASTRYPLEGAHLAVPCDRCHRTPRGRRVAELHPAFAACTDCHADPHDGRAKRAAGPAGCPACHAVTAWRAVAFDHASTRYPLEGRHREVACVACHPVDPDAPPGRLAFAGRPAECAGCHRDPHDGQLAAAGVTRCERCHTTADWQPSLFDHARAAAWALDGAHVRVACAGCHRTERRGERDVVRYKPLAFGCRDCHTGGTP